MREQLLEVKHLKKTYPLYGGRGRLFGPKQRMCALDDLSFVAGQPRAAANGTPLGSRNDWRTFSLHLYHTTKDENVKPFCKKKITKFPRDRASRQAKPFAVGSLPGHQLDHREGSVALHLNPDALTALLRFL